MKCLILAGGSGDRLWPLSRRNYPKQFMEIREGRSLLQETVARNIPFCEEFLIVTNQRYQYILEGQMKAFQGLKYQVFIESEPRKTAPSVALVCSCLNPSEMVFVIAADHLIQGEGYKSAVLDSKKLAENGGLVAIGLEAKSPHGGYGYIRREGQRITEFVEKPSVALAAEFLLSGQYLWNSGMFLFRAGDFMQEVKHCLPDLYCACITGGKQMIREGHQIRFPETLMQLLPKVSLEHGIFEKTKKAFVVLGDFYWKDISELEALASYLEGEYQENSIVEDCRNVMVVNHSDDQLVVANGLQDLVIVNTQDALYVSKWGISYNIKNIAQNNFKQYANYFENNAVQYRPWGTYELLEERPGYRVKRVVIYPGKGMSFHMHHHRSEQWSVVEGTATITMNKDTIDYGVGQAVAVPPGEPHKVFNRYDQKVTIIEISIGAFVEDEDTIYISNEDVTRAESASLVKLEPAYKDYLWGGDRLKTLFGKKCDYDVLAESWELSSHDAGQSVIAEGKYKGLLFGEYLTMIGKDALGWKCQAFDRFPILIKFIDAKQPLSIQVHPEDEYALLVEQEYGKNEVWHVLDCEENAYLYCGFSRDMTKDELRRRIKDNTLLEVLNKVTVHKGDTIFVEAGTVHAIGAGILICEIQQNSNCTYRLYDYGRKDKFGNLRELHLEKALDVVNLHRQSGLVNQNPKVKGDGYQKCFLCQCKYFESVLYEVEQQIEINGDDASFLSILFLEGRGRIILGNEQMEFHKGESFFVSAGKQKLLIDGLCKFIATHI